MISSQFARIIAQRLEQVRGDVPAVRRIEGIPREGRLRQDGLLQVKKMRCKYFLDVIIFFKLETQKVIPYPHNSLIRPFTALFSYNL